MWQSEVLRQEPKGLVERPVRYRVLPFPMVARRQNSAGGLVWGDWCRRCSEGHLLARLAGDISSSRPDFPADAVRSGSQGWPKAIAQRPALDGGGHRVNVKFPQSGDTGVSRSFSSVSTTVTIPRGARHRARVARHELVFGRQGRSHHDAVMPIGGEAPRGGPILNRGAKAVVQRRNYRRLGPSTTARASP